MYKIIRRAVKNNSYKIFMDDNFTLLTILRMQQKYKLVEITKENERMFLLNENLRIEFN